MEGEKDCAHMLLATSACGLADRVQDLISKRTDVTVHAHGRDQMTRAALKRQM